MKKCPHRAFHFVPIRNPSNNANPKSNNTYSKAMKLAAKRIKPRSRKIAAAVNIIKIII